MYLGYWCLNSEYKREDIVLEPFQEINKNPIDAILYSAMFFKSISITFLLLTDPASSIVKPAAIHITSTPDSKK